MIRTQPTTTPTSVVSDIVYIELLLVLLSFDGEEVLSLRGEGLWVVFVNLGNCVWGSNDDQRHARNAHVITEHALKCLTISPSQLFSFETFPIK
jgi:hypothetical protein